MKQFLTAVTLATLLSCTSQKPTTLSPLNDYSMHKERDSKYIEHWLTDQIYLNKPINPFILNLETNQKIKLNDKWKRNNLFLNKTYDSLAKTGKQFIEYTTTLNKTNNEKITHKYNKFPSQTSINEMIIRSTIFKSNSTNYEGRHISSKGITYVKFNYNSPSFKALIDDINTYGFNTDHIAYRYLIARNITEKYLSTLKEQHYQIEGTDLEINYIETEDLQLLYQENIQFQEQINNEIYK